jgi:malate/lactate dehydrogenase
MGKVGSCSKGLKVKILGMGNVGSIIASHLVASDLPITHLYIWDTFLGIAAGNEYDLKDLNNVLGKYIDISINQTVSDADIFIVASGLARKTSHEEQHHAANYQIVRRCMKMCNPERPIIIVTNPYDWISEKMNKEYPLRDVIGAGYRLDASRRKAYGTDPERIAEYILDSKGYTAFGIAGEVLQIVRFLCYGKEGARYEHEAAINE